MTNTADTASATVQEYRLSEGGYVYETVTAGSPLEALEIARRNVEAVNYDSPAHTIWVEVGVETVEGEEASWLSEWVQADPDEPACSSAEHAWADGSPIGHGGGAVVTDTCDKCGLERTVDTSAQNPANGEQGLRSIAYTTAAARRASRA